MTYHKTYAARIEITGPAADHDVVARELERAIRGLKIAGTERSVASVQVTFEAEGTKEK